MHVLVVNVFFAPNTYGGATIVAEEVAKKLNDRSGVRVSAVSATRRADLPAYNLIRSECGGIMNTMINLPEERGYIEAYQNPRVAERLGMIARDLNPDVVHMHCVQDIGADCLRAFQQQGIPVVLSVHDFWWLCERQFMIRPDGRYCGQSPICLSQCRGCVDDHERARSRAETLRGIAGDADLVTYPSAFARDLCESSGLAPGRGVVWQNGVRLPEPGFQNRQAARRANDPRVTFGFVGGPSQIKGWPLMRDAFAAVGRDDFRGLLVDGSLDNSWWTGRNIAAMRGDWQVVPRFTQTDMDAFWAEVDVLVFLSQWKETFGLTIREALARGIRVIQTESGGTMEHDGGDLVRTLPIGAGPRALVPILKDAIDAGQMEKDPVDVMSYGRQADAFLELVAPLVNPSQATVDLQVA